MLRCSEAEVGAVTASPPVFVSVLGEGHHGRRRQSLIAGNHFLRDSSTGIGKTLETHGSSDKYDTPGLPQVQRPYGHGGTDATIDEGSETR